MQTLNATELAATLNLSKGRISQLVSDGRLDGCYTGDGRARRFDPTLVAQKLRGGLDQGQMLGNGAETSKAISAVLAGESQDAPPQKAVSSRASDGALADDDNDGYRMARQAKLSEEVRRIRRQNELDEGTMVLASEVERQVAKVLRQEIAQVEEALRTGARAVADQFGVDFRAVRQVLMTVWRAQRQDRSGVLDEQAEAADMTEAEKAADI
jgi:phosphodiesterase/alkaline phosphatase D-like protein